MKSTGYQDLEISIRYSSETGYFYASMLMHGEFITEFLSDSGEEICEIADSLLNESEDRDDFQSSEVVMEYLQKGHSK